MRVLMRAFGLIGVLLVAGGAFAGDNILFAPGVLINMVDVENFPDFSGKGQLTFYDRNKPLPTNAARCRIDIANSHLVSLYEDGKSINGWSFDFAKGCKFKQDQAEAIRAVYSNTLKDLRKACAAIHCDFTWLDYNGNKVAVRVKRSHHMDIHVDAETDSPRE